MLAELTSSKTLSAVAIIMGTALVAVAFYFSTPMTSVGEGMTIQRASEDNRHVYGSPRAQTVIVEFSDYQCPYCARLHPTLKQIVDGSDGTVAWEYRHLPLRTHPLAFPAAVAAECLARNVGQEAFWKFTDEVFANQTQLTEAVIETKAQNLGLSTEALDACFANPAIEALIKNDTETAAALGGSGTPFSVIIFPDNTYKPVSGAVPYEQWVNLLQTYETAQ